METERNSEWWKPFYQDLYFEFLSHTSKREEIDETVQFLIDELRLGDNDKVFDQCCGFGRIAFPLADSGISVIGVDQSSSFVKHATDKCRHGYKACRFVAADAREFRCEPQCNAAVNWFTSFGYFIEDTENMKLFQAAFDSIKPGGKFVLDYLNFAFLLSDLRADSVQEIETQKFGSVLVCIQSDPSLSIDLRDGMFSSKYTFVLSDGNRIILDTRIKMYLPHQIADMLRSCGFENIQFWGSTRREPLSRKSSRVIASCRKPH